MSEATREIREICRSITLEDPAVVERLHREARSGAMPPAVFIALLDRGWGRPIPMEPEKAKQDPLLFVTTHGRVPWDPEVDPGRARSAQMIADKEAQLVLEAEARKAAPVMIDPAKPEDEGESLVSVDIPELPEPFHPRVRERDREPRGRS